jgi:hypothetical protein
MTLEIACRGLIDQFLELRTCLRTLDITVVEDRPTSPSVAFVDRLSDGVQDLVGWTEEALAVIREAALASPSIPSDVALRSLSDCQAPYGRILRKYASEVGARDRFDELRAIGKERGPAWSAWAGSVAQALEACQPPIFETGDSLVRCWRELAERAGAASISVQTTTVGQYVVPRRRVPDGIDH